MLNFIKLILKIKLRDNNYSYEFKNSIEEFIKIVLFTQGYKEDLGNIFNAFLELANYCDNIEERINKILNDNIIEYELSERNKEYTKIVNLCFLYLTEAFIRSLLICGIDLIKKDKTKFNSFSCCLITIEKIFINLNKK